MSAHLVGLWACYFIGQLLHVLLRATAVVRSPQSGITSYRQFLNVHGAPLAVRVFLATMGLILWAGNPQIVSDLLQKAGVGVGDTVLPLNAATAGLYGYFADSLLDKLGVFIPQLQKDVPPALADALAPPKV
jgi:hypothetical protein